jgi:hypothetical protein
MTTVTEAAKRLVGGDDEAALREGDLARICADPVLAQRFVRRLAEAAREISPGRAWSIEDLRDVCEAAVRGPRVEGVGVFEGRYLRKRLREQCALAERYGDPFSVVVLTFAEIPDGVTYESALDAVIERLRRSDMVFVYKRRLVLVLPRVRSGALAPLVGRVVALVGDSTGLGVATATLSYPDPAVSETQAVLDWIEDRLRDD